MGGLPLRALEVSHNRSLLCKRPVTEASGDQARRPADPIATAEPRGGRARKVGGVSVPHGSRRSTARRPGRVAAFFDLDKTIIATSSVFAFNRSFIEEGLLTRRSVVDLALAQLSFSLSDADDEQMARLRQAMATATKGWLPDQVEEIVSQALTEVVRPQVYEEARDLLAEHRALGHDLVLVSASGEELIAPIARMLGVDHYAGTRMRLDPDGRYAGEIEFYCQGPGKVEAMRSFAERYRYDLDLCHAYSDSITDLPMLGAVGHPVAVNPDRALRREAFERGWPVLTFEQSTPLLDKLSPATGTVVGLGSVVVAATVTGWTLGMLARRTG